MQNPVKDFFKELVFINWYRKIKGTTVAKPERIEPKLEPDPSKEVAPEERGFNSK